jgi:hypothetical protein
MSIDPYYGKSIAQMIVPKELRFIATPALPQLQPKWWDEEFISSHPKWWYDAIEDPVRLVPVTVKDGTLEVDNGGSKTRYREFRAAPKWMQDKVLKLSMMPEMHTPIVGLGRRCRDGLYQVLVPEHIVSGGGPKPRKKWGRT